MQSGLRVAPHTVQANSRIDAPSRNSIFPAFVPEQVALVPLQRILHVSDLPQAQTLLHYVRSADLFWPQCDCMPCFDRSGIAVSVV